MLRVVIDPGVLVSALITTTGPPALLLSAWRDGLFDVVVSPRLLDELADALSREKLRRYVTQQSADAYVTAVRREATLIDDPADVPLGPTPDPDDDYLICLMAAAGADVLVSGDKHLTGIARVMMPRAFLDALQPS